MCLGRGHRYGIVGLDAGTGADERIKQYQRWCLTHVVGTGFEGETPDTETSTAEVITDAMSELDVDGDSAAQDIAVALPSLPVLARLDEADPADVDAERESWGPL